MFKKFKHMLSLALNAFRLFQMIEFLRDHLDDLM